MQFTVFDRMAVVGTFDQNVPHSLWEGAWLQPSYVCLCVMHSESILFLSWNF